MEDEDLTASLNDTESGAGEEKPATKKKATPKKKATKEKKATPKNKVVEEEPIVEEVKETNGKAFDPYEDFLNMLKDVKISRGTEMITDVFFNGDIDDPEWLDKTLVLGNIPIKTRELLITKYYGMSPEDMGLELLPQSKAAAKAKKDKENKGGSGEILTLADVQQSQAQLLQARLQAASTKRAIEDLENMEAGNRDKKPMSRSVIERPLIKDGEVVMKDGIPVIERIVSEGEATQMIGGGGGSDMATMLAFMKVSKDDNKPIPIDPNVKPLWAVELENSVKMNKADEEKRRVEDELKHEKEKRDELDKEHKRELEKIKEDHDKELAKISGEITYKMDSIKDAFNAELQHRSEMDEIKSVFGGEIGRLKDDMERSQKDIKTSVVTEITKTGSKLVDRTTAGFDAVVQPMAEVAKDMYKAQIESMRGQQGFNDIETVPDTTEDELTKLV